MMRLSAGLSDRRWFWVLIVPALLYSLVPWRVGKPPVTSFQNRVLVLSLISAIALILWLALRQKLFGEAAPQTNWWLDQLQNLVIAVFIIVVSLLMGKLYERSPWWGYALQIALALAFGYVTWRMAYIRNWKRIDLKS